MIHRGGAAGFAVRLSAAAAAAGLGWYVLVRPLHVGLAQTRAELASQRFEIADHESKYGHDKSDLDRTIETLTATRELLNARSAASTDPARIYEALGAIAGECNVRIERIEPSRAAAKEHRASSDKGVAIECIGYTIDLTGPYAGIASFLTRVDTDLGLSRVVAMRMAQAQLAGDPSMLAATIETQHGHFVMPSDPKAGTKNAPAKKKEGAGTAPKTGATKEKK